MAENPLSLPVAGLYRRIQAINRAVAALGQRPRSPALVAQVQARLQQLQPFREELRRREAARAGALADYSLQELKLLMDGLLSDRVQVLGCLPDGQALEGEAYDRYWQLEHEILALTLAMQARLQRQGRQ